MQFVFAKQIKELGLIAQNRFLAVFKADKTREGVVADYKNFARLIERAMEFKANGTTHECFDPDSGFWMNSQTAKVENVIQNKASAKQQRNICCPYSPCACGYGHAFFAIFSMPAKLIPYIKTTGRRKSQAYSFSIFKKWKKRYV